VADRSDAEWLRSAALTKVHGRAASAQPSRSPERLFAAARGLANGRKDGGLDGARPDEKLASASKRLRAARTES
jgi:hypothetical protein